MSEEKVLQDPERARGEEILRGERTGVLALGGETGDPYAALVAYLPSEDGREIYFATLRATRKFARLLAQPQVAILIDTRRRRDEDLTEAEALTAFGSAEEPAGTERSRIRAAFVARHPALEGFVADPGCALVRIRVRRYLFVTRFQQVHEWNP